MSFLSRRHLLGRLGLLLGSAAATMIPGSTVLAATGPPSTALRKLELYGRGWHLHAPNRIRGELPRQGDRMSIHGILLDGVDGKEIGQFYSACFCPDTPGMSGTFAQISLEMHTFTLTDGSIMGIGMGGPSFGQTSRFAIVGGTGRYSGARGDYAAMQDPLELAGSGRAEFRFSFIGGDMT